MKTSVFSVSLLVAGLAFAGSTEITNDYVIGAMPVTSSKGQVILSVPWVEEGGGTAIAISNLVKTAGLDSGDSLTWYNTTTGKFQKWTLEVRDGVKYWSAVAVVSAESADETPPDNAQLRQGQAIVLTRASTSNPIYIVGQVGTNSTASTTVQGSSWSLLAPPRGSTSSVDFNECATVDGGWASCVGDEITVDGENGIYTTYKCVDRGADKNPRYCWATSKYATSLVATIPAGCGLWYRRNNSSAVTINWRDVPSM